jgi:hypothetical protein
MTDLSPGQLIWVEPEIAVGREQAGRRPALVVAGHDYLITVDTLAIVVRSPVLIAAGQIMFSSMVAPWLELVGP